MRIDQPHAYLRRDARDTERKAADAASIRSGTWRFRVLEAIYLEGGATDDRVAERLDDRIVANHVATRRKELAELYERALVQDSGRVEETRRGNEAVVWEIPPSELRLVRSILGISNRRVVRTSL